MQVEQVVDVQSIITVYVKDIEADAVLLTLVLIITEWKQSFHILCDVNFRTIVAVCHP